MLRWVLKKWPIKIRDDRGREVNLASEPRYESHEFLSSRWSTKYIGKHHGHRLEWEARSRVTWVQVMLIGLSAPGLTWVAKWLTSPLTVPGKQVITLAALMAVMWPLFPLLLRIQRWEERSRLRSGYLAAGHCPSCDYPLGECGIAADGCRVCPECGAAWKLASAPASVQSTPA
jgi:hypothetical protein